MTPSANIHHPAIAQAESITLLYLLHSVPTPPSANRPSYLPLRQEGYTLSFTRERNLVGTLAFLSNIKDDPDHIPAVCVKEDPISSSLSLLLAVNRDKAGDGKVVLEDIKRGFERICSKLSQVSDRQNTPSMETDIFAAIVTMCSRRILCRLRLVRNVRNKSKQPLKDVLQEAIGSIAQLKIGQLGELFPIATLFIQKAKEVTKLVDSWAKHQTPARLRDLIEGVYHLWKIGELEALLGAIPNRAMGPSSRTSLYNTVSKVARYREAARFLYRTAKKFHLVRQMKVILANLPENAFYKIPADDYTPKLASTVKRITAGHRKQDLSHICRLLGTTELQANERFANQTRKTITKAKIHAEIQLLFYCELNASTLPPRIICSSKDACFLCNAFILMHGKMHMPRYHGRLYPGWRLPLIPTFNDTEQRFNSVLENEVRSSLGTLLSRQRKTVYPDPNESTLLTLPISTSTLRSLEPSEIIGGTGEVSQGEQTDEAVAENPLIGPSTQALPMPLGNIPSASSLTETEPIAASERDVEHPASEHPSSNGTAPQSILSTLSSFRKSSFNSTADDSGELSQGVMLSRSIAVGKKSLLYAAGPLEAQIEYAAEEAPKVSDGALRELRYGIEWLTVEEATILRERQAASIIDAEALRTETQHELDGQNCLFIGVRETVIKIHVRPGFAQPGG